jgi:hypothetical protein
VREWNSREYVSPRLRRLAPPEGKWQVAGITRPGPLNIKKSFDKHIHSFKNRSMFGIEADKFNNN